MPSEHIRNVLVHQNHRTILCHVNTARSGGLPIRYIYSPSSALKTLSIEMVVKWPITNNHIIRIAEAIDGSYTGGWQVRWETIQIRYPIPRHSVHSLPANVNRP